MRIFCVLQLLQVAVFPFQHILVHHQHYLLSYPVFGPYGITRVLQTTASTKDHAYKWPRPRTMSRRIDSFLGFDHDSHFVENFIQFKQWFFQFNQIVVSLFNLFCLFFIKIKTRKDLNIFTLTYTIDHIFQLFLTFLGFRTGQTNSDTADRVRPSLRPWKPDLRSWSVISSWRLILRLVWILKLMIAPAACKQAVMKFQNLLKIILLFLKQFHGLSKSFCINWCLLPELSQK